MKQPRFLLAAGASGSGKTLLTCGILRTLTKMGKKVSSFKCGPDYIDPLFHSQVLKTKTGNLDTYFTGEDMTRYLFGRTAEGTDISVIEGVMGYYDGLGGTSLKASTWEVAHVTRTPVIFIVNGKGMSRSISAYVKGFLDYRKDSNIKGIILNQTSPMIYEELKEMIEKETGAAVLGYVPKMTDCLIESRHLGLVLPEEVTDLELKLDNLSQMLEKTLDFNKILELAGKAPDLETTRPEDWFTPSSFGQDKSGAEYNGLKGGKRTVIGVAKDEAFCFIYQDNLRLLEEMGAQIRFFSPLHDKKLPEDITGLLLCGGYPELFAQKLQDNTSMRLDIAEKIQAQMPCMAECGGFLYLHETMEDMNGNEFKMAGVIKGKAYRTEKLGRFGYIGLTPLKDQLLGMDMGEIKGHEFHYFDSTCCGTSFLAKKPNGRRQWECICGSDTLIGGFPHLYYYSNPGVVLRFLLKCKEYGGKSLWT